MGTYRRNYKGVDESGFELLPTGNYSVEIAKVQEGKTKDGKKDLIKIRYRVILPADHKGRLIFDQITLLQGDEPGAGITKHFLHVIDEPYDGDFEIIPENWIGKKLNVGVVVDEQYNNNKIKTHDAFEDIPF